MGTVYYRYIADVQERNRLVLSKTVISLNRATGYATWYSPTRYDDPAVAQQQLALPSPTLPIYRIGPIPESAIPNLTVGPRRVAPGFGHAGGGIEIATNRPVQLLGLWSFALSAYDSTL